MMFEKLAKEGWVQYGTGNEWYALLEETYSINGQMRYNGKRNLLTIYSYNDKFKVDEAFIEQMKKFIDGVKIEVIER